MGGAPDSCGAERAEGLECVGIDKLNVPVPCDLNARWCHGG